MQVRRTPPLRLTSPSRPLTGPNPLPISPLLDMMSAYRTQKGPLNFLSARRHPYPVIDGAVRVRAFEIYKRHTQTNAIGFVDSVEKKFPF